MSEAKPYISLKDTKKYEDLPGIVVIGVGGAGCNAINNMKGKDISEKVKFIATNTDIQPLSISKADKIIQLGKKTTGGQGAGSYSEVGMISAEESREEIIEVLKETKLLFLTAGMGGGTGTGATPVIAKIAKEMDILTVAVVTKPFNYESGLRLKVAEQGIKELEKYVDTMIVLPNENLFRIANKDTTMINAFASSDNVLYLGVKGITDLITTPGLINLDFADVKTIIKKMGRTIIGMGESEGENRAINAVEAALSNPLLEDINIKSATGILVNITGSPDMTLFEFDESVKRIREEIGDNNATIKIGTAFMKELEGRIRVSIFATGIDVYSNSVLHTDIFSDNDKEEKKLNVDENVFTPITEKSDDKDKIEEQFIPKNKEKEEETEKNSDARTGIHVGKRMNSNESAYFPGLRKPIDGTIFGENKKNKSGFFGKMLNNVFNEKETSSIEDNSNNKISTKNDVLHYKSRSKEIEIKNNNSQEFNDNDLFNIPAILRRNKDDKNN
jgi:cell division protein FtsZ